MSIDPERVPVVVGVGQAIERDGVPADLEVTATSDDGEIMGVRHRRFDVEGVQFHPEAILTEHGMRLLANFLENRR